MASIKNENINVESMMNSGANPSFVGIESPSPNQNYWNGEAVKAP